MLWRLLARVLTGPVAFFVAGVIDFGAFVWHRLAALWNRPASIPLGDREIA